MSAARPSMLRPDHASLVVHGRDQPGIVAVVTEVLARHGANIVALDQHSDDPEGGAFFQRTVFHLPGYPAQRPALEQDLGAALADGFELEWRFTDLSVPRRVAIFASKSDHCLLDLVWRQRRGELPMTISMVVSNHPDMAEDVRGFGIPFFHVPTQDKAAAEAEHLRLLQGNVDLVVLARYMQILSSTFLTEVGVPVINIHHSFLPSFKGAKPYHQAYERGVKTVGATAHYVNAELDEGPIIAQQLVDVDHTYGPDDLVAAGRDTECKALSNAVKWHCEGRVILHGNRTVVLR